MACLPLCFHRSNTLRKWGGVPVAQDFIKHCGEIRLWDPNSEIEGNGLRRGIEGKTYVRKKKKQKTKKTEENATERKGWTTKCDEQQYIWDIDMNIKNWEKRFTITVVEITTLGRVIRIIFLFYSYMQITLDSSAKDEGPTCIRVFYFQLTKDVSLSRIFVTLLRKCDASDATSNAFR